MSFPTNYSGARPPKSSIVPPKLSLPSIPAIAIEAAGAIVSALPMADADSHRDKPCKTYKALLRTGKYSDFTVRCDNKVFNLHKIVLSYGSEFFRAAIDGGFKESTENLMIVNEAKPWIFAVVVAHLYFGNQTIDALLGKITKSFPKSDAFPVQFTDFETSNLCSFAGAVDIYQLADRMMLQELKQSAQEHIGEFLFFARCADLDGPNPLPYEKLQDYVQYLYETLPESDNSARAQLTTSIITDPEVSLNRKKKVSGSGPERPSGLDRLIDLAEEYDSVGFNVGKNVLSELRRNGLSKELDEIKRDHYDYKEFQVRK